MFKELLKRADLANIGEFIMHGGDFVNLPEDKTDGERIKQAYSEIHSFIESNFEEDSLDDKADILTSPISVLESSYFELGLLSGIKLGYQL